ncbi:MULTISPECIES: HAMP domain-containing sensor histidine kinase [Paenibacillus]|uniref:Heme sensor protein HssS n=1 Tax=Paenibacillus pabuli TaxID=1472 RepID=A0A855Y1A3_9BACL|nr:MULTISPECIES: HAMP domain-containing sensor histidine kinase [Paenibacillus]PWW34679.1 signal transduction histidine kinase [Paenibacillus pabuli]PXW01567.1 signal transduction histidine kinase [Paenibacillus taichungensis]
MIKTLYVRIIFTFLVVIIFSLLSSFLIGLFLFKKEVNHIGQNDMIAAGEEMIRLYEQTHPEDREAFIKSMVKISTYPIHLYDVSGNVTYYDLDNTETVQIAPEVVQMVLQGQVYRSPAEVDQTFIGLPFPFEGEPQAVFMQFSPQNENIINRMVFLILLLALFIGSLCIFIAARYLVRPIQVLTRATKQLAKGDFDVEIQTKRVDEMGALTHSFNEMASELKQLEQMRQDFVSNVSHEIQTPLTSISGFAMAMKNSSLVAEADRNYYLDIIITESGRLSRLSDNLLELASLDSDHHPFEAATYNLDEQIRQIIVTCEPQWSTKNIQVHLELAEPIQVTADRDQLDQVWMNLLGNSIKFTPAGGHIHIRTHQLENKILITITDTGIGIAPEQLDYVFDRFYKTDLSRNRSISGNGLGLAIVKKIVMLHHGTVEMKSQEGEGTTVMVHLPLA